ncbi:hypothetical protein [Psychromarinibacter halotolerans]|uniref:Uncharacterized protein n=1 Tax=Psychromarinibacter halotolerans TaxID=1775175 RepID=A0ABV7GZ50_9RHOB|nr:hypothetical protein [Psychromarinibacter halotolerans]MDF0596321.1 hypothetical protein [Psychromarinibacter halotolerans]
MSKFDVKVVGSKPPKRPEGAIKRLRRRIGGGVKAVLIRPRMIFVSGIAGFVLFVGTPHVGWDYQCSHSTRGFGSCNSAAWCAYYGIQGRRVERPGYGERCQLVTFIPLNWNKLIEGVLK